MAGASVSPVTHEETEAVSEFMIFRATQLSSCGQNQALWITRLSCTMYKGSLFYFWAILIRADLLCKANPLWNLSRF